MGLPMINPLRLGKKKEFKLIWNTGPWVSVTIEPVIGLCNYSFEQLKGMLSFIVLVVYVQHEMVLLTVLILSMN